MYLVFTHLFWGQRPVNRIQQNTSILHGVTIYLTYITQLLDNAGIPLLKPIVKLLGFRLPVRTVKDLEMAAGTKGLTCLSEARRDVGM